MRGYFQKYGSDGQLLPEWPLDAPQPGDRQIDLAVVSTENGRIRCLLTSGGNTDVFYLQKHVAASLIAELARALAVSS